MARRPGRPRDAAAPLADRVEWAVFSLLSTAGPLSEAAFYERIATLFTGHDLPDEALVRACLDSYRSLASTPDRLVTADDLLRRSQEHTELLAALADGGHRLGMRVWLGRAGADADASATASSATCLDEREQHAYLGGISRAVDELAEVDCDLVRPRQGRLPVRGRVDGDARRAAPPPARPHPARRALVRFLVIAPERTELVRYKLERSPLLRAAIEAGNWHIIKSDPPAHVPRPRSARPRRPRAATSASTRSIERSGEQMPLFGG